MENKKSHEILIYIFLTYLVTWTLCGLGYFLYTVDNNYNLFGIIVSISGFVPSIMGIILTAYFYKDVGITDLFKRINIHKSHGIYCIIGMIIVAVYVVSTFFLTQSMGFNETFKVNFFNILSWFIMVFTIGGGIGEEFGWRGFLLDKVLKRQNIAFSGIFVGIVWSLWHLPLFFIPGSSQYGCPIAIHIMNAIIISMIITFVFKKTKGCITFSIMLHATSNALFTSLASSYSSTSKYYQFLNENQIKLVIIMIAIIVFIGVVETLLFNRHKDKLNIHTASEKITRSFFYNIYYNIH